MIMNSNRQRFSGASSASTPVAAGTCLDIPVDWLGTETLGNKAELLVARSRCRGWGSSYRALRADDKRDLLRAQRGAHVGEPYGAFSFTRGQLNAATRSTVGDRSRYPTWDDLDTYERRLASQNAYAKRQASGKQITGPGVIFDDVNGQKVFLSDVAIVWGEGPWFCFGRPCTVGQYVFTGPSGDVYRGLMEHEYIHVLQWEGRSGEFVRTYFRQLLEAGLQYSAGHPEESVAYLWQFRSQYLGKWEPLPWDVWQTPWWPRS